jgi:predicted GNAT family acetyltransferase
MTPIHPLDRPVWQTLSGRQQTLSLGGDLARRFDPDYGAFAASRDASPEALAALEALIPAGGAVWLVEAEAPALPPGTVAKVSAVCNQMVCEALTSPNTPAAFEIAGLTEADAPQMLALATLTNPGPFFARTHQLGDFVGVKTAEGRLLAMAGERMRPPGFTEVSGVCTHPDALGRGYAAALTRRVTQGILARGEAAFLHVYDSNARAIAVYEALGFRLRRTVIATVVERA